MSLITRLHTTRVQPQTSLIKRPAPRILVRDRLRLAGRASIQNAAHTILKVPPHILSLPLIPFLFTGQLILQGAAQFIRAFRRPSLSHLPG